MDKVLSATHLWFLPAAELTGGHFQGIPAAFTELHSKYFAF